MPKRNKSKNHNSTPKLGLTASSELVKRRSSSRLLSTADNVPHAGSKVPRDEYGTDAKNKLKKEVTATVAEAEVAEAEVQLVLGVPTTDEERASIALKRQERLRQQNERESERAKEAKTKNDEAGYPMPESKEHIKKMSQDERMSQGLCFQNKNHLLSRLMANGEVDKKRYEITESRPLSLIAKCPFRHAESCAFNMSAGYRKKTPYKTFDEQQQDALAGI